MSNEIYRVVNIPNEYSIVINAGKNDNISIGNVFEIYSEGNEIIDPVTEESLGALDLIKATLEAVNVFEKMSLCKNKIRDSGLNDLGVLMATGFNGRRKSLNVEELQISGDFVNSKEKIKIGDKVRKV